MEAQDNRLRDVSSVALKTVMSELPDTINCQTVGCIKRIVPRLINGLSKFDDVSFFKFKKFLENTTKTDSAVKMEMLEILNNLILRYGRSVSLNFDEVENFILNVFYLGNMH